MADTIKRVYLIEATATDAVNELRRLQKEAASTTAAMKSTGAASKGLGADALEGAKGMEAISFSTTAAKRELIVLAHELSQGSYKRFGGSLLVLAEQTNFASVAFSAAGLAVLGFGAIVVGLIASYVVAEHEIDTFNKTLLLTGNAAGVTGSSFKQLNQDIAEQTHQSVSNIKELANQFIASGQIGSQTYQQLLTVSGTFARLSGQDIDKVGDQFIKLAGDPTRGALELNKTVNFLTASTYELIRQTQLNGDTQGATRITLDAVSQALKDRQEPALTAAARGWLNLKGNIEAAKNALEVFLTGGTSQDKLKGLYSDLATNQRQLNDIKTPQQEKLRPELLEQQADIRKRIGDAIVSNSKERDKAITDGENARIHSEAVHAQQELDLLAGSEKGRARYNQQLKKLTSEENAIIAERKLANPNYDPSKDAAFQAQHDANLAQLRKQNETPADKRLENAQRDYLANIQKEDAAIRDVTEQYRLYGKAIDQSAVAKLKERLANPADSLFGSGKSFVDKALAAARQEDADAQEQASEKAHQTVQKRINDLKTQADQEAQTAREIAVAAALGQQSREAIVGGYDKTTEAYRKDSAALIENVNRLQDQATARKLLTADLASNEEIKKLQQETDLIGANTLQRKLATNALKIQAEANKLKKDDPSQSSNIQADADRNIAATNAAITANYNALREFSAGAKTAFSSYVEDAENAAKFSQGFIEGSLTQIEDVFVNFAKTGKLSFSSLFQFMADEFLRQSVKLNLTNLIKGNEGDLTGFLSKIFGSIGLGGSGSGAAGAAAGAGGAAATGSLNTSLATLTATFGAADPVVTLFADTSGFAGDALDIMTSATDLSVDSLYAFTQALDNATIAAGGSVGSGSGASGLAGAAGSALSDSSFGDALYQAIYGGSFAFASGGIMSALGKVPLNTYASGGIANKPQLAMFGEGRMNEAYVPLPDGKSIPVSMVGSGGGSSGGMNVVIENHNSSDVSVKKEKGLSGQEQLRVFVRAAKADILNDVYGGGELDKALSSKYGVNRSAGTPRRGSFN